jgi:amino acid adenylation domain-containing protein
VSVEGTVITDPPPRSDPAPRYTSGPELPTADSLGFGEWAPDPGGVVVARHDAGPLRERARAHDLALPDLLLAAFVEVVAAWSRHPGFTLRLGADEVLAVDGAGGPPRAQRYREVARARQLSAEAAPQPGAGHAYPVSFSVGPAAEPVDGALRCRAEITDTTVTLRWWAAAGTFAPGVPAALTDALNRLLDDLSRDDAAWASTGTVTPPAAPLAVRRRANATAAPLPEGLLHDDVVAQCRRTPDRVAVVASDATVTYGQLLDRAEAVAATLRRHGCAPGSVVAIGLAKSAAQVVAVLGTLLAGAAYLPLDSAQPPARRARILGDAGVRLVLTAPGGDADLPPGVRAIAVTAEAGPPDGPTGDTAADHATATAGPGCDELAYIIYTSGSTGAPKGVMISHRAARNTIDDLNRRFSVGPDDRVLGLASLSFDLSVYDVFGLLATGGQLVLPEPGRRADAAHWAELATRHGVTVWNSVPAQFQLLVDHLETHGGHDGLGALRLAMLSGDWIPVNLPDRARTLLPTLRVVSLGGATEAAIWSVWYPIGTVGADWSRIPYGKPLANQSLHVLDDRLRDRPDWTVGELFIGGAGVALGYLGDPEKTAYRFVTHPETGERLYRTGDLARYHADGLVELLGREDRQVKVRGYRVEPAEVEAALTAHPAVREAVVVAQPDPSGEPRLVAYTVGDVAEDELRATVHRALPEYMVPAAFVALPGLPLTANGKVDRDALPDPRLLTRPRLDTPYAAGRTARERDLAAIWAEVIGVDRVGIDDDFFELGGNSMLATVLVAEARARSGLDLTVRLLFDEPTIRGLLRAMDGNGGAGEQA